MTARFVAFSGGADSTALALLEPDAIPAFTDTAWEFPAVYDHLDKFERLTGRQVIRIQHPDWPGGLPEYIRHYAFLPGHGARFCTKVFKIQAYNLFIQSHLPAEMLIGLRADEPPEQRIGNLTDLPGLTIRYPLRERGLRRLDVVKICLDNDLLPRREPYAARGGCIGCFYKREQEVKAMIHLIPDEIEKLQALEEEVQDERGQFAYMFPNAGKSIRQMRDEAAQPAFFDIAETYRQAADRSDYGQNCGVFCNR